jgi:hypothetical protein
MQLVPLHRGGHLRARDARHVPQRVGRADAGDERAAQGPARHAPGAEPRAVPTRRRLPRHRAAGEGRAGTDSPGGLSDWFTRVVALTPGPGCQIGLQRLLHSLPRGVRLVRLVYKGCCTHSRGCQIGQIGLQGLLHSLPGGVRLVRLVYMGCCTHSRGVCQIGQIGLHGPHRLSYICVLTTADQCKIT